MKNIVYLFLFISTSVLSQSIDSLLIKNNKKTIPYITINDFKKLTELTILDTREQKEFNVSHLKNAECVGYDKFEIKKIKEKYKNVNDTIVVYCSVGIRSEIIGTKLKKAGYKNVFNLYGGIFEWKNKGETVLNTNNVATEKIHTFSKIWSKFLKKGIKVF